MFDVGIWEMALIVLIALVVLGPERLPTAARTLGRWVGTARRYAQNLRHELEDEVGTGDLRREFDSLRGEVDSIRGEVSRGGRNLRAEVEGGEAPDNASRQPEEQDAADSGGDLAADREDTDHSGRRLHAETASDDGTPSESSRDNAAGQESGKTQVAATDAESRE